jgi:hypothetical protein
VRGWLVPSAGQKIPIQPGWYLPPQKISLAENRFLQAGNGAENTKEKIQAMLYTSQKVHGIFVVVIYNPSFVEPPHKQKSLRS